MIIIGAKKWLQFTSVGVICALFAGSVVGLWRCTPSPPKPPTPIVCQEKADLRTFENGAWDCTAPAHVEIYATNTYSSSGDQISLFKCVCGDAPKVVDSTSIPLTVEPTNLKEPILTIHKQ